MLNPYHIQVLTYARVIKVNISCPQWSRRKERKEVQQSTSPLFESQFHHLWIREHRPDGLERLSQIENPLFCSSLYPNAFPFLTLLHLDCLVYSDMSVKMELKAFLSSFQKLLLNFLIAPDRAVLIFLSVTSVILQFVYLHPPLDYELTEGSLYCSFSACS